MDLKTIFTIFHLLGVVVGMGGAVMTDLMFAYSTKDKILDQEEVNFISLGSRAVWVGISIIILSGTALFLLDMERYLDSTKFLAKMTIVLILFINGIVFHKKHLPTLRSLIGQNLATSGEFIKKSTVLYISGAISVTSWLSALILGSLRSLPYSYLTIVLIYVLILGVAILSALCVRKMFLKQK